MRKKIILAIVFGCLLQLKSFCQNTIPAQTENTKNGYLGPGKIVVKIDPVSGMPIGNVPFDRNFIARYYFINLADIPKKVYIYSSKKNEPLGFYAITANAADYDKDDNFKYFKFGIDVLMPILQPNRSYTLLFVSDQSLVQLQEYLEIFKLIYDNKENDAIKKHDVYRNNNSNSRNIPLFNELKLYYSQNSLSIIFDKYDGNLNESSTDLLAKMKTVDYYNRASDGAQVKIYQNVLPVGTLSTKQYTVQTDAALHIVAEGGVIFAGFQKGFNIASPYVGLNISLRPFDSDISIRTLMKYRQISLIQRFSVNVGLTLNSIAKTGYRSNLFGNDNIMAGIGFKFNHYVSLIGGGLFYNNVDPNPLVDKKKLGVAPYVGLSLNLKIKEALGDIVKLFTYGK